MKRKREGQAVGGKENTPRDCVKRRKGKVVVRKGLILTEKVPGLQQFNRGGRREPLEGGRSEIRDPSGLAPKKELPRSFTVKGLYCDPADERARGPQRVGSFKYFCGGPLR